MNSSSSNSILFILTLPPPSHGSNIINNILWNSEIQDHFRCLLLDISDHRTLQNIGRLDWQNIFLALKAIFSFIDILRKEKPALIYLPLSQNKLAFLRDGIFIHLAQYFSARSFKPTILVHLHGSRFRQFYEQAPWWFQIFIRRSLSLVQVAIVLSPNLRNIFSPWIKKVYVVANGLNINWPWDVSDKIIRNESRTPVITFLSNLLLSKGILDFLEAIFMVKAKYPETIVQIGGEIYGKKTERQIIEKKLEEVKKLSQVFYFGPVSEAQKSELFRETDIFVLPSYDEGQPLSLIEAMAAGCALIATPVGSVAEMIKDGQNGLLVPPGQPKILAEKIIWLIQNPSIRKKLSEEARRTYENNYTKEIFIANMIKVFKSLLQEK